MASFRLFIMLLLAVCSIQLMLNTLHHSCGAGSTICTNNVWIGGMLAFASNGEKCTSVNGTTTLIPAHSQFQDSDIIDNVDINSSHKYLALNEIYLPETSEYISDVWMFMYITVTESIMTVIQFKTMEFIHTVLLDYDSNVVKPLVMQQNSTTKDHLYLQHSVRCMYATISTENDTLIMSDNSYIIKPDVPVKHNTSSVDSPKCFTTGTRSTDNSIDLYKLTEKRNCIKNNYLALMKTAHTCSSRPEPFNLENGTSLYMIALVLVSVYRLAQIIADIACNIKIDSKNVSGKSTKNKEVSLHCDSDDNSLNSKNLYSEYKTYFNQNSNNEPLCKVDVPQHLDDSIFNNNVSKNLYADYKKYFSNNINEPKPKVDVSQHSDDSIFNLIISRNLYTEYKMHFNQKNNNELMAKVDVPQHSDDSIFHNKVSGNMYTEYKQYFNYKNNNEPIAKVDVPQLSDDSIFNSNISKNLYDEYKKNFNNKQKNDLTDKVDVCQHSDDSIFNNKVSKTLYAEYQQYFSNTNNKGHNNLVDPVYADEPVDPVIDSSLLGNKPEVHPKPPNVFRRLTKKCGKLFVKDKKNTVQPNTKILSKFVKKLLKAKSMLKRSNKIVPL